MALFEIRNLTFTYPEAKTPALQEVNVAIEQGEFIVICGKSGCGKTTLLRHFKTALTPYGTRSGEIRFLGDALEQVSVRTQASEIGYVLQSPDNQIVTDKVWHEMAFGLENLGYDQQTIRLRVAEMASFFGIQNWFAKNVEELYQKLTNLVHSVKNPDLHRLLAVFFVEDTEFIKKFRFSSAAKSVHHGFVGGLLEHTVSVAQLCDFYAGRYEILNRDLLITAALCHDIGKTKELSAFPENDYTDEGQLLGHIMIGSQMIHDKIREIEGFPEKLERELQHCVLAHHGELEYGSPKKPALAEAAALNLADNTDARMETLTEIFQAAGPQEDWLGYNRLFESNLRRSSQ